MSSDVRVRVFVEPQQGASYEDQLAMAQLAELLGFDAFFRSDHYLAMSGDGMPGPTDSWITLAGIARETSRIRLGTLLSSATFRWPGILAIAVAQVDAMSGGRVELGLGAGWFAEEHLAYGIPFPPTGERFDRLEECLAVVKGLWGTPVGERYAYEGSHQRLENSPALPKPVQQPGPPIIVGGGGPSRTPHLAARYADEFNLPPSRTPEEAVDLYGRVHRACEDEGRDPATIGLSAACTVYCGADDADVARRVAASGRDLDSMAQTAAVGRPDQVVTRLRQYVDAGARTIYLQLLDMRDLEHVALLAAEVLPHL
jgi:alkanesulfonate monooxygenase